MTIRKSPLWTILLLIVLSVSLSANVSIIRDNPNIDIDKLTQTNDNNIESASAVYTGSIRVHIIEPLSRWLDDTDVPFDNAHLSYALKTSLNIPDATVWDTTITWDGSMKGFSDVTVDNIGTAVAVFDDVDVIVDARPTYGYWFAANYADASAMAHPGIPGMNETAPGFTHSVYIEEGTATW